MKEVADGWVKELIKREEAYVIENEVLQVDFHIGVQFNFQVVSSLDAEKHKAQIAWFPWGVVIRSLSNAGKQKPIAVYASNIKRILFDDVKEKVVPITKKK